MAGLSGHEVLKEAAAMMSEFLLEKEGLSELTAEEIMSRIDITKMAITGVLGTSTFLTDDGFALCKGLGFDIGIAVRKPDGSEFIFYPARNFGPYSPQSSPKPAEIEPSPAVPGPKSILLPAPLTAPDASAPTSAKTKRPIGFIQHLLHLTPKADMADPENPFPGINEYEV